MPQFLGSRSIKPFVNKDLTSALENPILFKNPSGGGIAYGYPATILPDICEVILDASNSGVLPTHHELIAHQCDVIYRALVRVSIVALIDEATGYQEVREQRALATILEKFIAQELQSWTKTFPIGFYKEIFRLKQWELDPRSQRPAVLGHYTNNIVYSRLAPGILDELQARNPTLPTGRRWSLHHQWFTTGVGHPKLREHLAAVTALMRVSDTWYEFQKNLERAFPLQTEEDSQSPDSN